MILWYLFLLSDLTQLFKHYAFIYLLQNVSAVISQKHSNLNGKYTEMEGLPFTVVLKYVRWLFVL